MCGATSKVQLTMLGNVEWAFQMEHPEGTKALSWDGLGRDRIQIAVQAGSAQSSAGERDGDKV